MVTTTLLVRLAVVALAASPADQRATPDEQRIADFVIAGFRAGRDEMARGVFRVREQGHHTGRESVDIEEQVFCAFDSGARCYRFDRSDRRDVRKYVRTPENVLLHVSGGNVVSSNRPDTKAPEPFQVFDIRAVGLVNQTELQLGMSVEDKLRFNASKPLMECVAEGEGLYRVSWFYSKIEVKTTVWFDESKSYAPVRMEQRALNTKDPSQWREPLATNEVSWVQISGAWVPATAKMVVNRKHEFKDEFHWESVNEAVPDSLFTADGMDLPGGTYLADRKLAKSVIVRELGSPTLPPPPRNYAMIVGVVLAVAVLSGVGLLLLRRYRHA